MNEYPLVSVLIPCYNHEDFLNDCLCSVMAQDYTNIELLICDDCSPDNSFEKILSYKERLEERFSHVVILQNEVNCGVTKNINRMLQMAEGAFIKTIASDDAMAPNAISSMVAYLQAHPEMSVVVSNGIKIPEEQHYPDFRSEQRIYTSAPDFSKEGFFERVACCNQISAPAAMVRTSVYKEYGLYDETVKVEDYEFWLRILKDGKAQFGFLDADLLYYRINANSMTSMKNNAGLARRRKLFHESEIGSLKKYQEYLSKEAYADIVLMRILSERWLAIEHHLTDWEEELRREWKAFSHWADLQPGRKLSLCLLYQRQNFKKLLQWRGR